LNWALRGLDRLREYGYFEMPKASLDAMQTLEDLASPVRAFVRERCETEAVRDADGKHAPLRVHVKVLWAAYRQWCEGERQEVGSQVVFGRNLKAAVPHVTAAGRHPDRYYRHIQLRDEAGREQRKANRG
jgi:putative DNA primase/helicase